MNKDSLPEADKGRRSGAERRLKYITPYVKFVYKGDDKRDEEHRRSDEERRKESRKGDEDLGPRTED